MPLVPPPAASDGASTEAALPSARWATSAAFVGATAWILGGYGPTGAPLAEIVSFEPATGVVATCGCALPSPRAEASAAVAQGNVYLFGGRTAGGAPTAQIVRFTPSTGVATAVASLPTARTLTAAASDGRYVYVLGGLDALGDGLDDIVRYDAQTNSVTLLATPLPDWLFGAAGVWFDGAAYSIAGYGAHDAGGGNVGEETFYHTIRYRPSTGVVEELETTGLSRRMEFPAVTNGREIFVFGGRVAQTPATTMSVIARVNPSNAAASFMSASLPSARWGASAVFDGTDAWLFGGHTPGAPLDAIVRYNLRPGPPLNPSARTGPGAGEITVSWRAPNAATYSAPITAYRVRDADTDELVATTTGAALAFKHTGLAPGEVRRYAVHAVTEAGEGAASAVAEASAPVPPGAPRDVLATPYAPLGTTRVTWSRPATDGGAPITGYRIERGLTPDSLAPVGQVGLVLAYHDTGCRIGQVCHYAVRALNGAGEGDASAPVLVPGSKP